MSFICIINIYLYKIYLYVNITKNEESYFKYQGSLIYFPYKDLKHLIVLHMSYFLHAFTLIFLLKKLLKK